MFISWHTKAFLSLFVVTKLGKRQTLTYPVIALMNVAFGPAISDCLCLGRKVGARSKKAATSEAPLMVIENELAGRGRNRTVKGKDGGRR